MKVSFLDMAHSHSGNFKGVHIILCGQDKDANMTIFAWALAPVESSEFYCICDLVRSLACALVGLKKIAQIVKAEVTVEGDEADEAADVMKTYMNKTHQYMVEHKR